MSASDPLLQPFTLKHLRLKNRVMSTSHAISYQEDGKPKERYQLYHEEKAKGGLALTMFGGSSMVAPDSPSIFGQLDVGDDGIVPYFRQFAERIHGHGCALMCQISHMGRRTVWNAENWLPTIAPSRLREPAHRCVPKEMDRADIARIVTAFGQAARRCRDGGLDGCEILAHGHLLGQFWSPATNWRSDAFGGSLDNRLRFGLLVLEEVRRQVGGDFIVGLRMAMTEDLAGGLGEAECLEIARIHEVSGLVDFLNLNHGHIDTDAGLAAMMPGMAVRSAPFLDMAGRFRRELGLPIFHACRITDVATARHAIREGLVDMIGMTRAHIADPHILRKIDSGQEARIRPCVGATYCSDHRLCIQNPATGREAALPHLVAPSSGPRRKVVVVGGGPAGLEAARVSALRGHEVVLFEAANRLGGQLVLAAKAAWRGDLMGIADWLAAEVEHLGVRVLCDSFADRAGVLVESPDIVVVATGGLPDLAWLDGHDRCDSVWGLLAGAVPVQKTVLLFDGTGQSQGASGAEFLADHGATVELVTPDSMAALGTGKLEVSTYLKHFYEKGVTVTPDRRLTAVAWMNGKLLASLENILTGRGEERLVDQVVVENGTVPVDGLYCELQPDSANDGVTDVAALLEGRAQAAGETDGFLLFRVGDAVSSRDIHAAIFDSLRLCVTF